MGYSQVQRNVRRGRRQAYRADASNPRAAALCDGCKFLVNHDTLRKQMQYRGGDTPVWTGQLVCGACLDVPQPYFKKQVLKPDPVPVRLPRPDDAPNAADWLMGKSADGALFFINTGNTAYGVAQPLLWNE